MAREMFYLEMSDQVDQFPQLSFVGACVTYGQPTGNFCDPCVEAGYTFEVPSVGKLWPVPRSVGYVKPSICYVCAGLVPPGPVGQPTVPIMTLAPVMRAADEP